MIRRYLRLIDRIIYSQLESLVSWRNALIVLTSIFCFIALQTKDSVIVTVVFGIWATIIGFYLHLRQQSDREGRVAKSKYEEEVEVEKEENKDVDKSD